MDTDRRFKWWSGSDRRPEYPPLYIELCALAEKVTLCHPPETQMYEWLLTNVLSGGVGLTDAANTVHPPPPPHTHTHIHIHTVVNFCNGMDISQHSPKYLNSC